MKNIAIVTLGLTLGTQAMAADLVVGVPNWPSAEVTANVIAEAAEQMLGLEVELQNGTNPVIFEAMSKGSMHVHPEVWLPNQMALVDEYSATTKLNENPASAQVGLCVNGAAAKAGVTNIIDLTDPDKAALFDTNGDGSGELYIGATGWASTAIERVRAKSYGYAQTMSLSELDEGVAYAQLDNAQKAGKPWVGACYTPHHIFTIHPDFVFLEEEAHNPDKWNMIQPDADPEWLEKSEVATGWSSAKLQAAYATSLETDLPNVAGMLAKMDLSPADYSAFAYSVVIEGKDAGAVAQEWVAANSDRVSGWLN